MILAQVLLLIDPVAGNFSQLTSDAANIWNNIKNAAFQIWPGIRQTVSFVWNGIKITVVNIAFVLREAAVSASRRMVSGSGAAFSGLYSVVSNGVSYAHRLITGGPTVLYPVGICPT